LLQYTGSGGSTDRLYTLGTNGGGLDSSGAGPISFSNTGSIAFSGSGPRTFTFAGSNTGNNTIAQALADGSGGATSVLKTGSGTWVLNNINKYTGITSIAAGTLRYGGSDAGPSSNNQAYVLSPANPVGDTLSNGSLGLDFDVNSSITIKQLGVYDNGRDGLSNSHNVYIYNRVTQAALVTLNFPAGTSGTLSSDGYRFLALPSPLALGAGNYSIVVDYLAGTSDRDYSPGHNVGTTNNGGGAVSFVGLGRAGSTGSYPTGVFNGPAYCFGAGSFLFDAGAAGRIPGDLSINGPTAVLDLGNNQNGNVVTVTLDGGGSITGTGTSTLTSRGSYQLKSGSVTATLAGSGIPLVKSTAGTVTLSGANTFSGGTTISGGVLNINADVALGAVPSSPATNLTFSGNGILQAAAGMTLSANRGLAISGGASGGFDTNGNTVNVAGALSNSGTLLKQGAGVLEVRGTMTLANNATIQASAGTLRFNSTSASSVGAGTTAAVAAGATLELDGVNSELTDPTTRTHRASVTNNGTLAVGNTAIAANTVQQVGGINGSGAVTLANNASFTADHIIQTSLVIGNGGTFTLAPSDANGNSMVGDSSSLVLAASLATSDSTVGAGNGLLAAAGESNSSSPVSLGGVGSTGSGAVPEPSTTILVLLGSTAFLVVRQRRRVC
jgi:fibronectin-binding autotransporter adhesin